MSLVLGPILRHVGETTALVWVQTSRPTTVQVLDATARTVEIAGHHFALVPLTGLTPDTRTPYSVELDGEQVWPPATSPFPPSVIPTRGPATAGRAQIVFGSCRYGKVDDRAFARRLGIDALDAFAARMARGPVEEWPEALLLLGDQVYADELTPQHRRRLAARTDRNPDWPDDEIVGFDEYVGLYVAAWSDPEIRWIMSTVPTAMIFDDHDVRDDWNTSAAWRAEIRRKPWWRTRIRSALASYWVFQHLGNLSPDQLAADRDWQAVLTHDGDAWPIVEALADRADAETGGAKDVRFSFRWDVGRTRIVMIDSRNGRILDGRREMLGDDEFRWVEEQVRASGEVDHLVLGTSLPWLMPPAIAELETANEISAHRPGRRGRLAEKVRQAADLEHWPAFRASFDRLTALVARAASSGVASVSVVSGDVHDSYAAAAQLADASPGAAPVHQLVCSPVHNVLDWFVPPFFRAAWSRVATRLADLWASRAGAPPKRVTWRKLAGPFFGNTIATLRLDGRTAVAVFEQPLSAASLVERSRLELTP
ncbi:PhoD-like phosphatase [Pseudonocardia thermophila]|uniref:PhoD-like phosphatase n=1 Tax=Pseudonocardia thermophila TaxID=1848 RepID=A0A1M6Q7W1_PSETH|nr:alkaline phosphatase D family protein [Pseudonocardia thermophila]SHK16281.1 PhoD-like phosphatase [Pseudonocardia thermophila]